MGFKTENHEDMTLFRNRLWKLTEKKGINSATKLARELCKENLVKVNFRETEEVFTDKDIAQRKIWAIERKVKNHLNSETAECLKGDFVLAYCKFFGCSADYLFGKIECSTHEKQICHNLTGLSEDAIEILEKEKNSFFPYVLTAINFLLEKDNYIDDKRELFRLILQYILLSPNIKSYYECNVASMENIRQNINGFNFSIDNLSIMHRRFEENNTMKGGLKTDAGKNRFVPIHPLIKPLIENRINEAIYCNLITSLMI